MGSKRGFSYTSEVILERAMVSALPVDRGGFGPSGGAMRILLIEDNDGDCTLAKLSIQETDIGPFEIIRVDTLRDGLAVIGDGAVDVVLTDLGLPDAQGQDVVARIHDLAPDLPIVVLSGSVDPKTLSRALAAGAKDFVEKDCLLGPDLDQAILHSLSA
jgi:CheY-like chemotaxis protein